MNAVLRARDLAIILGSPSLRHMLQRARAAGLETLLDYQRLALLVAAARYCKDLSGDAIEFGCYRGGSAAVIGQVLAGTGKVLHVCDSFDGLPPPTASDNYHNQGDFSDTSEQLVRQGLQSLGLPSQLHVGYFDATLPRLASLRFAIAHVDVDLYQSVLDCLTFCYPRMVPGGIIILDDYGSPTCLGAKAAADEFFADKMDVIIRLSEPAYGVWIGSGRTDLSRFLRRRAGWISALPAVGAAIYR